MNASACLLLFGAALASSFNVAVFDHHSRKTLELADTLEVTPALDTGVAAVADLLKLVKDSPVPNLLTVSLTDEGGHRFDSSLLVKSKQKVYSLIFEVTLAGCDDQVSSISVLLGADAKTPGNVVYKRTQNLDFQTFDPMTSKPSATYQSQSHAQAQPQAQNPRTTSQGAQDKNAPPQPEEEQSFFKKYFWFIVIGGMLLFNLLNADTTKLKEAYNQAQQQAQQQQQGRQRRN